MGPARHHKASAHSRAGPRWPYPHGSRCRYAGLSPSAPGGAQRGVPAEAPWSGGAQRGVPAETPWLGGHSKGSQQRPRGRGQGVAPASRGHKEDPRPVCVEAAGCSRHPGGWSMTQGSGRPVPLSVLGRILPPSFQLRSLPQSWLLAAIGRHPPSCLSHGLSLLPGTQGGPRWGPFNLNLITCAKTLFPNKAAFPGLGAGLQRVF